MAKRSFRGYRASEPVEFTLESADGNRTLDVTAKRSVPGFVILDFLGQADTANPGTLAKVVTNLLRGCIPDDQWDAVETFVRDEENGIDIDTLSELAGWLTEAYGARNPQQPVPSRAS